MPVDGNNTPWSVPGVCVCVCRLLGISLSRECVHGCVSLVANSPQSVACRSSGRSTVCKKHLRTEARRQRVCAAQHAAFFDPVFSL
jgi:hypothetical protein